MVKPGKDPSLNELLDRIVRLENQTAKLRAQVTDLGRAFQTLTKAHGDEIDELHDLVWPVLHKVFPGFAADQKQIAAIIKPKKASPEAKRNPR
jgi:hypothetical protein